MSAPVTYSFPLASSLTFTQLFAVSLSDTRAAVGVLPARATDAQNRWCNSKKHYCSSQQGRYMAGTGADPVGGAHGTCLAKHTGEAQATAGNKR